MIFNTTYTLGPKLTPLEQEEILHTPEFFAMSRDDVIAHPRCPAHLRRVLEAMPFGDRPNYVQVRPQDFRRGWPHVLGRAWHCDVNTPLANGRMNLAAHLDEFRSMVVSFGDVVETEFAKGPLEIDVSKVDPFDHGAFAAHVDSLRPETVTLAPDQVAWYSSRDVHRVGSQVRLGRVRLIIVTVECDKPVEKDGGEVRPTIHERDLNQSARG